MQCLRRQTTWISCNDHALRRRSIRARWYASTHRLFRLRQSIERLVAADCLPILRQMLFDSATTERIKSERYIDTVGGSLVRLASWMSLSAASP